jgi:hypothetical protein
MEETTVMLRQKTRHPVNLGRYRCGLAYSYVDLRVVVIGLVPLIPLTLKEMFLLRG